MVTGAALPEARLEEERKKEDTLNLYIFCYK
jgi:hypothetical protein